MAEIPAALLHRYAGLGVLLLAWFGLIHILPRTAVRYLPKELIPGPFFAAAVFIPCVAERHVVPAALFFGLVCVLNCLYIFAWEHTGATGEAHTTTRIGVRLLTPLACFCAVGPLVWLAFAPELAPIWVAIGSAAALLFALDRARGRLSRTTLRAAADLVLLTPLLLVPLQLATLPR
jgi:hypothetical protein